MVESVVMKVLVSSPEMILREPLQTLASSIPPPTVIIVGLPDIGRAMVANIINRAESSIVSLSLTNWTCEVCWAQGVLLEYESQLAKSFRLERYLYISIGIIGILLWYEDLCSYSCTI